MISNSSSSEFALYTATPTQLQCGSQIFLAFYMYITSDNIRRSDYYFNMTWFWQWYNFAKTFWSSTEFQSWVDWFKTVVARVF